MSSLKTGSAGGAASISRRDVLAGFAGLAGAGLAGSARAAEPSTESLDAQARRRGMRFGFEITAGQLASDPRMKAAIVRDAGILVPGNELKWRPLQMERRPPNYAPGETIIGFAEEHKLLVRGHTLVWHQNPPIWAMPELSSAGGSKLVLDHVREVAGHFKGRILEWDVVNEAVMPTDGKPGGLRDWPLYNELGYDFLADCFKVAHEADPDAKLFYNEFGIEYGDRLSKDKRQRTLNLLIELRKRNAPIHGFGIQSHLTVGWRFSERSYRRFLADVAGLGLAIRLTEFDVDDSAVEGARADRDKRVSAEAKRFLDASFDESAVNGLVTWGVTNPTSFLNVAGPRPDGTLRRCLLLDENYERTPLWHTISDCFANAPER